MGWELGSGGGRCGLVAFLLGSVVVKALGGSVGAGHGAYVRSIPTRHYLGVCPG